MVLRVSCTNALLIIPLQLAEALVEHETLDLEEMKKIIAGHKIREGEKHNVSNVQVTTVTTTPLPTPPPDSAPQPVGAAAREGT